jgi:hypothetical protein
LTGGNFLQKSAYGDDAIASGSGNPNGEIPFHCSLPAFRNLEILPY